MEKKRCIHAYKWALSLYRTPSHFCCHDVRWKNLLLLFIFDSIGYVTIQLRIVWQALECFELYRGMGILSTIIPRSKPEKAHKIIVFTSSLVLQANSLLKKILFTFLLFLCITLYLFWVYIFSGILLYLFLGITFQDLRRGEEKSWIACILQCGIGSGRSLRTCRRKALDRTTFKQVLYLHLLQDLNV